MRKIVLWILCVFGLMMSHVFGNSHLNVSSLSSVDIRNDVVCEDADLTPNPRYVWDYGLYTASLRNNSTTEPLFVHNYKVAIIDPSWYFTYNYTTDGGSPSLLVFNRSYFQGRSPAWSIPPNTKIRHMTTAEEIGGTSTFSDPTWMFTSPYTSPFSPSFTFSQPNYKIVNHPATRTDPPNYDVQFRVMTLTDYDDNASDTSGSNRNYVSVTCENYVIRRCGDGLRWPEKGEQCDDGNNVNGDGCSSTCQTEQLDPPTIDIDKQRSTLASSSFRDNGTLPVGVTEYYYRIQATAVWGNTSRGTVRIIDQLPAGIDYVWPISQTPSQTNKLACQYIAGSRTVDCDWKNVVGGETATVTFKVRIADTNQSLTAVNEACLMPENVCDPTTTVYDPPAPVEPTIDIDKQRSTNASSNFRDTGTLPAWVTEYYYRIQATAIWGNTTLDPVTITDPLPNGIDFVNGSFAGSDFLLNPSVSSKLTCSYNAWSRNVSCDRRNVVDGDVATITFKVRIADTSQSLTAINEACFRLPWNRPTVVDPNHCDDTTTTYNPPAPDTKICDLETVSMSNQSIGVVGFDEQFQLRARLANYPNAVTVRFFYQGNSNVTVATIPYSSTNQIHTTAVVTQNLSQIPPLPDNPLPFGVEVLDANGNVIPHEQWSSCGVPINIEPECDALVVTRNGVPLTNQTLTPWETLQTTCTVDFARSVDLVRTLNMSPLNPVTSLTNPWAPNTTELEINQDFVGTISVPSTPGTLTLRCDVTWVASLDAPQTNACTRTFQVVQPGEPGLSIKKRNDLNNQTVQQGTTFDWIVDFSYNGDASTNATNVVITDTLPLWVTLAPWGQATRSLNGWPSNNASYNSSTRVVTANVGTLWQWDAGILTIPVVVETDTCSELLNTARIDSASIIFDPAIHIDTNTVPCEQGDLWGTKEQSRDGQNWQTTDITVAQGETIRYRVRYTHGIGGAINGTLVDTIPAGTSLNTSSVVLTLNGQTQPNACSFTTVAWRDSITCPNITLSPTQDIVELVFQVTVNDTQTYNRFCNGWNTFDTTISDYSTYYEFGGEKRRTNEVCANTSQPNIVVQKRFTDASGSEITQIRPGETALFRLAVTNNGANIANDVLVCDRMPAELTYVSHTPTSFSTLASDPNCAGNRSFTIPSIWAGQMTEIVVTSTVSQTASARFCNYAYARWRSSWSTTYDQQSPEDNACLDIYNPQPNLWIDKEFVDPVTRIPYPDNYLAQAGETVWIRLQYRNFEDADASVVSVIDQHIRNNTSQNGMIFTGVYVADVWGIPVMFNNIDAWTLSQPLNNNDGFQTLYVQVQIDPNFVGTLITNTATINLNGIEQHRDTDTLIVQQVDIDIEKTADTTTARQWDEVTFTLRYTNERPDVGVTSYTIRDFLPPTLEYVAGSATINGTQSATPTIVTDPVTWVQTLTWICDPMSGSLWSSCDLPPLQSREIVFRARVR